MGNSGIHDNFTGDEHVSLEFSKAEKLAGRKREAAPVYEWENR
jgi:hypothetical protein